jgi:DNA-binding response OmpR family regulator
MAVRSVLVVAPPSVVERLRATCPEVDVLESSLDRLEESVSRVGPAAVVTWVVPSDDAVPVLSRVRARDRATRLIAVTAGGDVDGRLAAIAAGIDEALPPIGVDELAGRLRLATRRPARRRPGRLRIDTGVELDLRRRELLRDGRWIHLRPKEARLLEVLIRADGRPLTRALILARVWGTDHRGDPRTVDVHVRWLRAKIEPEPRRPRRLLTVRGIGYRFEPVNGLLTDA